MYIFLHILNLLPDDAFPFFQASAFSLKKDAGVAESFQYVKELWVTVFLLWFLIQHRHYALLGISLLFAYFLLDDMMMVHEYLGDLTAGLFVNFPLLSRFPNLEADSLGEFFSAGLLGLAFIPAIFLPYRRSTGITRQVFRTLFGMLALFLLFAVVVDLFKGFIGHPLIREIFDLLEDGGEMLAMSLICWYSWSLVGEFRRCDIQAELPAVTMTRFR